MVSGIAAAAVVEEVVVEGVLQVDVVEAAV